jgi:1-phosphofructokinase family hexose kinase
MIYTLTLNPTIDRTMHFPRLALGTLNRASSARMDISGKGVNVSMGLRRFGIESVAMGFAAGTSGRIFVESLRALGYECDFVHADGETRSNITVIDEATGATTKLNEPGPTATEEHLGALERRLLERVREGDLCVFSGSLPPGAPIGFYAQLIAATHSRGAKAVLDTSGEALTLGCAARPELVKPNADEAESLLARPLANDAELVGGTNELLALGPQRVLLSLGSRGAVLADGASVYLGEPPAITEVSAVGAGDALMAAALWAWGQGLPTEEIIRWAVASGTAAAMQNGSAMPALEQIRALYARIQVRCLTNGGAGSH